MSISPYFETAIDQILNYKESKPLVKVLKCVGSYTIELYLIQLEESLIVYTPETKCFIAKVSWDHKQLDTITRTHNLMVDELLDQLEEEADRMGMDLDQDDMIPMCI